MYFMSDPQALHVTRNVIPGKLGVDLHLHRVHIPLVVFAFVLFSRQLTLQLDTMCPWCQVTACVGRHHTTAGHNVSLVPGDCMRWQALRAMS